MNINDTVRSLNVGLPQDILRMKLYGDFEGAVRLIDRRLARTDIPQGLRDCMTAQREMMLRTPPDYPFTREEALELVRERIPDFSDGEFDQRVDDGRIGWIYRNGEPRYFDRFSRPCARWTRTSPGGRACRRGAPAWMGSTTWTASAA